MSNRNSDAPRAAIRAMAMLVSGRLPRQPMGSPWIVLALLRKNQVPIAIVRSAPRGIPTAGGRAKENVRLVRDLRMEMARSRTAKSRLLVQVTTVPRKMRAATLTAQATNNAMMTSGMRASGEVMGTALTFEIRGDRAKRGNREAQLLGRPLDRGVRGHLNSRMGVTASASSMCDRRQE